ncbi:MAG: choice-of-anchor D domain-containing protein [Cytophagales bacterium]|nr:choice-of-anchor D domain-containing protein [Cytophagales bacterium]MDW8383256.1 choice-of-anchor D domain-containing protein [Flammeovirgaceae bacterium]
MKTFLLCLLILCSLTSFAQTNPTPQAIPYTQDFSSLTHSSTTYPAGWQGHTISTSPGASYNTTGPTSDRSLVQNATAADNVGNVYNYNGKIGFLNTGSLDLTLTLAINTSNAYNIEVQYDIMTIRNPYDGSSNTRINEVSLQYRVGVTGAWTTLTGQEYQNNTTPQTSGTTPQKLETKSVILPSACNNQPVVQLRWASRQVSGTGARPSFAVDNIDIRPLNKFWDVSAGAGNGVGGTGTWGTTFSFHDNGSATLTTASATDSVIFQGSSGTVTLNANQTVAGMRVNASGYSIATSGGDRTLTGGINLMSNNLTLAPAAATTLTLPSVISGNGSLTQNGAGTTVLGGANTYTGGTTISNGILSISADNNLGASGSNVTINNATLATTATFSSPKVFTLNHANSTIDVASGTTFTITSTNGLTGSGGLIKTGAGTLKLDQTNNYTGKTIINGGTINAAGEGRFGTNPGSFVPDQITLNGGTIQATDGNITFDSNRGITLGASGGTFDVGATRTITARNVITGTGDLTKTGDGVLVFDVLSTGTHTYTGATIINAGTLRLGNSHDIPNNSNMVLNGGTFSTGSGVGYSDSLGTLQLLENSTIALGTGSHTIVFAASNAVSWTSGKTITITGWTGTAGSAGTAGRIFVGNSSSGLTTAQLSQINFSGFGSGAEILSTGEVVPASPPTRLKITAIDFVSPVSALTAGQPFRITVQSQDNAGIPKNVTSNTDVQIAKVIGDGNLSGTLTGTIPSGSNTVIISGVLYSEADTARFRVFRTSGMTLSPDTSTTQRFFGLSEIILPQFIQGLDGTNNNRIPTAYYVKFFGLNPNRTHRVINQVIVSSDGITTDGAGNCIFVDGSGNFSRTSSPSLSTAGSHFSFTTNSFGEYSGWFITEPTGNTRFAPNNNIYIRFIIDTSNNGVADIRLTTSGSLNVLNFSTSTGAGNGSGIRSTSMGTPKNFVSVFDNTSGSGRPIACTYLESNGLDEPDANYVDFHDTHVDGTNGAWGIIFPNDNSNGVRRIEQRSRTDGSLVGCAYTSNNGVWGSVNTTDNTGSTAMVITDGYLVCAPEINVKQNNTDYASGSTFAYGQRLLANNHDMTFVIQNLGGANLTITSTTVSGTGFSLVSSPASPVAPGDSATFVVRFTPATSGSYTGTLTINNNDFNEGTYTINLTGLCTPEINVQESGSDIPDNTGSVNFGSVSTNSYAEKTFLIQNLGGAPMSLSYPSFTGSNPSDFTLQGEFPEDIAPFSTGSFILRFTPGATGARSANISFTNNDSDENPYNFALNGTGVTPPSVSITANDPTPSLELPLGSMNNVLYRIKVKSTGTSATINAITVTTLGSYNINDVTAFRLWYSADSVFNASSDESLGASFTSATAISNYVDGFTKVIAAGDSAYFFVTANISINQSAAGKTVGAKINVKEHVHFVGTPNWGTISIVSGAAHNIVSPSVRFNIAESSISEGTGVGTTTYNIALRLFGNIPTNQDITFAISGTATWGGSNDFTFGTLGSGFTKITENASTLVIRTPLSSISTPFTLNIPVNILRDAIDENNETVVLTITNAGPIHIDNNNKIFTLTIHDDDEPSVISMRSPLQIMGESGSTAQRTYTVYMDIVPATPLASTIKIKVTNHAGATYGGTHPNDYITSPAVVSDTITVNASVNAASVSFTVTVTEDALGLNESPDSVTFEIVSATNGILINNTQKRHRLEIVDGAFLDVGDFLILGVNANDNGCSGQPDDYISFVCFKDITVGTSIDLTDNGYDRLDNGKWGNSEGTFRFTRTTSTIPANTIIKIKLPNTGTPSGVSPDNNWSVTNLNFGTTSFNMNSGGDQVYFMQGGTWNSGTSLGSHDAEYVGGRILFGFSSSGSWCTSNCNSSQKSKLYPNLECFNIAPSVATDFSSISSSVLTTPKTKREWVLAVGNSSNWVNRGNCSNYNANEPSGTITVNPGGFEKGLWVGSASTDWYNCANWQSLSIPELTDNVIIPSSASNHVTINTASKTAWCQNLIVQGGRSLTLGNGVLKLYGNLYDSGQFVHSGGTLEILGTTPTIIDTRDSTQTFHTVVINNPGGVIFNDSITITNSLALTSGEVNLNGKLLTLNNANLTLTSGTLNADAANSQISFTGSGNATLPSGSYERISINRSGATITMAGDVTLRGESGTALALDNGTLNLNSFKLTIENGDITGTNGSLFASGTNSDIVINGTGNVGTIRFAPSSGALDDFTLNRVSGSVTLGSNLTIEDQFILQNGEFNIGSNTLTLRNSIIQTDGTMRGGANARLVVSQVNGSTERLVIPEIFDSLKTIVMSRLNGASIAKSLLVRDTVQFQAGSGGIFTGNDTLNLGTTGVVIGETSGANNRYVNGILRVTRSIPANTNFGDVGGIGVLINNTSSTNLGNVTITRYAGATRSVLSPINTRGIERYWHIVPTTQPASNVTVTFRWPSDDDNNRNLANMQVWKRNETDTFWVRVGSTFTASGNPRSATVTTNSFSFWTISDLSNPLPLTLIFFSGKIENNQIVLRWRFSGENPSDVVLEKSFEGITFMPLSNVTALSEFIDVGLQSAYYRLRFRSKEGKELYSSVIYLQVEKEILLYPNPMRDNVTLEIDDERAEVSIYSADGALQLLVEETEEVLNHHINTWLSKAPHGYYLIKVKTLQNQQAFKMIKE